MTEARIWGFADFVCRSCRAAMLLESPELEASEPNLTGQTAVVCSGCESRVGARELPQSQQTQIAARLRLLLEADEFVPVHLAVTSLLGQPGNADSFRALAPAQRDDPSGLATPNDHAVPHHSGPEETVGEQTRAVKSDPSSVDWQQFLLVARLSPQEAKAVAATMKSNVGEPIQDRARRSSFSATRLRNRYFVAATGTEVFSDLTRYRNAGRVVKVGFSREEVVALAFGIPSGHELLEVSDAYRNIVGVLRFDRKRRSQFGSVEVFRRRPAPVK